VAISALKKTTDIGALAAAFRALPIPVIGHIKDRALVFDCRCLNDADRFIAQLAQLQVPTS
jgi:L-seryl-tRNA(Ser) seleniumtransferase